MSFVAPLYRPLDRAFVAAQAISNRTALRALDCPLLSLVDRVQLQALQHRLLKENLLFIKIIKEYQLLIF